MEREGERQREISSISDICLRSDCIEYWQEHPVHTHSHSHTHTSVSCIMSRELETKLRRSIWQKQFLFICKTFANLPKSTTTTNEFSCNLIKQPVHTDASDTSVESTPFHYELHRKFKEIIYQYMHLIFAIYHLKLLSCLSQIYYIHIKLSDSYIKYAFILCISSYKRKARNEKKTIAYFSALASAGKWW